MRFERKEITSGRSVVITIRDITECGDPLQDYREVLLQFDDGSEYISACWRNPKAGALSTHQSWSEEPGMIIVSDLVPEIILPVVEEIIQKGEAGQAFERLE